MPRLPRAVSTVVPQAPQRPYQRQPFRSADTLAAPGRALAGVGAKIAGIGEDILRKEVETRLFNEETKRVTDATLAIDQLTRESEGAEDFRGHEQRVTEGVGKIITRALGDTKGELQLRLKAKLDTELQKSVLKARAYTQSRERDFGRGELLRANDADLKRASSVTGKEREAIIDGIINRNRDAENGQLITAAQRQGLNEELLAKLERGRFLRDRRLDPQTALLDLLDNAYDFDGETREGYIHETENIIAHQENERRARENEARQNEVRVQRLLGQQLIERSIAGEDVSAELTVSRLGEQYQDTLNAVRGVQAARSRGDLVASDPATVTTLRARLLGVGALPTRGEIASAAAAGKLNPADMVGLLSGLSERERQNPWTPEQSLALGNAEQIIRDRLRLKVPGVDKWTEVDGERQALATNGALVEFFDLERKARQALQPFDALRVAQEVAAKWRNSSLITEGVSNANGVMTIFGQQYAEDAELEIARRVRAGQLDTDTARLLLRTADTLPRKPKPASSQRPATLTDRLAQQATPIIAPGFGF